MDQLANSLVAVIGYALVAGVPGYFVLQPWALNRFRGGWRIAAMVPLVGAVLTGLWSLYALSQDSNLWPLTFIFFAPVGSLYLAVLALLRHFALRRAVV